MPLQLRDKSDFIPKLTVNANVFKSNMFNTYYSCLQSIGVSVQIQTLGHLFPKLKSSMADQNQAAQVNFIPLRPFDIILFDFYLRFLPPSFLDRSFPPSFWFTPRPTQHPISSVLWELLILVNSLKPNPRESPSKRLYRGLLCGKMLSRTGLCPQLQVRETGIRGYLQITAPKPAIGTASASPNAWSYLWPKPQRMKIFW
jgi:hypothetical protein